MCQLVQQLPGQHLRLFEATHFGGGALVMLIPDAEEDLFDISVGGRKTHGTKSAKLPIDDLTPEMLCAATRSLGEAKWAYTTGSLGVNGANIKYN